MLADLIEQDSKILHVYSLPTGLVAGVKGPDAEVGWGGSGNFLLLRL